MGIKVTKNWPGGRRCRYWVSVGASIVLGLIFGIAGLGKLLRQAETYRIFYASDKALLTPALAGVLSVWLPRIELIVGLLLIIGVATKLIVIFSSVLIAAFIANNSWLLSQGLGYEPCGCFGILEIIFRGSLSTTGALYLDIGMLALAFMAIFWYPGNLLTTRLWFFEVALDGDKGDKKTSPHKAILEIRVTCDADQKATAPL